MKKQQGSSHSKETTNWWKQIINTILDDVVNSSNQLEPLLESYKKQNPQRLKEALGLLREFKNGNFTPLTFACTFCVNLAEPLNQEKALPRLKKIIFLLLDYGAHPDSHPDSEHPFDILFSDIRKSELPADYKFLFTDLVLALIEKGADLKRKHMNNMTVAHHAAALDHSRTILTAILEKDKELLKEKDSMGEQPLCSAIRFGNRAGALHLLLHYRPYIDIDSTNILGASALSASIFFVNPLAALNLLDQGADITASPSMSIRRTGQDGESEKITALLTVLAKAGYFIQYNDCESLHDELEAFLKICPKNDDRFYLLLEDEKTKETEHITDVEALLNTNIHPSQSKLKRLHQSFIMVKQKQESTNNRHLPLTEAIYLIFKAKFPLENADILPPPMPSDPQQQVPPRVLGLGHFPVMLKDALKLSTDNPLVALSFAKYSKNIIMGNAQIEYTQKELSEIILEYNRDLQDFLVQKNTEELTKLIVNHLNYQFMTEVVMRFVKAASSATELIAVNEKNLLIFALAAAYILQSDKKSTEYLMEALREILEVYEKLGVDPQKSLYYKLITWMFNIKVYSEQGFHSSINDILGDILNVQTLMIREHERFQKTNVNSVHNILTGLDKVLSLSLSRMDSESVHYMVLSSILSRAEEMASSVSLTQTQKSCETLREQLVVYYEKMLRSEKFVSWVTAGTDWFSLSYKNGRMRIVLDDAISLGKFKSYFAKDEDIKKDSEGFYFSVFGKSMDELRAAALLLKATNPQPFKKQDFKNTAPTSTGIYLEPTALDIQAKYQLPLSYSSSSSSSASTHKPTLFKEKFQVPNKSDMDDETTRRSVRHEIAQTLHVKDEDVFPINHPHFPRDKVFHAWAVWGEIRGDRTSMDNQQIEEHRKTAQAGRFCVSKGQQGLKSVKVEDPKTGASVWSIKTKRLGVHGNARIVATPEDIHSETLHEKVKVYKFGQITFHK